MHIPDGYLSPSTCGVMYAFVLPFWYGALIRLKAVFSTRAAPLISLFAAFSFVVMMLIFRFRGARPDTPSVWACDHRPRRAAASHTWLSRSRLLVQALFFGDEESAPSAPNCFNMAIVGSLVAYAVYRWWELQGEPHAAKRRVIRPGHWRAMCHQRFRSAGCHRIRHPAVLFHDASGAPLYCARIP